MSRLQVGIGTDNLTNQVVLILSVVCLVLETLSDNCHSPHPPQPEPTMTLAACRDACGEHDVLWIGAEECHCAILDGGVPDTGEPGRRGGGR